ncbi:MAG: PAS domain S-box protein [Polyangiaceae bacterium]
MDEPQAANSEERYFQILNTAPDAMLVVGPDQRIAFVNTQTETIFGYTRRELLGQTLDLLIPNRMRAAHEAHVSGFFANPKARLMGSGLALFGRHKSGTEIPIEVSLSPYHTEGGVSVSAAIRDITDRKRIETAARLNAERLASAVESIQDAFALYDASESLIQCNSSYRSLFGEALPGPLVGRSYEDLLEGKMKVFHFDGEEARLRFRADRLAERGESSRTYDVRSGDGRSFRVANRRTAEGGMVQTIWDITDDAKREEELRVARSAAEAGSAAKTEFLSSMSHELRTPLNAILGFAQLLQRDKKEPLSPRHTERVAQILKGGEHLLRLIDDILDLSRIEAGAVSISMEPVDVTDVLYEVKTTLEPSAAPGRVRVEIAELPSGLPLISADRVRFAQILMNYGSNAIKYNRLGGTLTFAVTMPSADYLRVTVVDTGMGIAEDKHATLFQPFQRAGQETGTIEGTGIGLAISKRLAELMNGRVGFRSVLSKGSEFWVEIPTHVSDARPTIEPALRGTPALEGERRGLVLYVEDNPANVSFMQDLLGGFEGIELITAPTAEMGVELARLRKPKVILMDINLPGMSGFDALRILQTWPETNQIPVIALTAAASDRDRERGEKAGFRRYLTKPVKVAELEAALEALLS